MPGKRGSGPSLRRREGSGAGAEVKRVPLRDPEERVKVLDEELGVDTQVLIPHGPFGHLYGGTPEGDDRPLPVRIAMIKAYNNAVGAIQRQYPDRFVATAILPFDDLEESRKESVRVVRELGIEAIQIPSNWMGQNFDCMDLYPFWDTINELDVPIFVHHIPQSCAGSLIDHAPRYPIIGLRPHATAPRWRVRRVRARVQPDGRCAVARRRIRHVP